MISNSPLQLLYISLYISYPVGGGGGGVLRYINDGDVEALFWVGNLRSEDFFWV